MASKKSSASNNDMTMKIVLVAVLIVVGVGGYLVARARYKPQILELNKMILDKDRAMEKLKFNSNRVFVKDGALWVIDNGVVSPLEDEMTFTNGDKIDTTGKIIQKDGEDVTLEEGDSVSMDGTVNRISDTEVSEQSGF